MSYTNNIARLSRLTAILLKLQTRPSVSVKALAEEFAVSTRTIYRDLEALEQSGVPVMAGEEGGYSLVEGYNVPPVMFTEAEANALIIAEKIVAKTKDYSLINDLGSAIDKVRSVLRNSEKDKAEFLSERTIIGKNWDNEVTSDLLADIKKALTNFNPIRIGYQRADETVSEREVEPFAIYHNTEENWILIAWCRLRKDFRTFRVDRIQALSVLPETFTPHDITLDEYVEMQKEKHQGTSSD